MNAKIARLENAQSQLTFALKIIDNPIHSIHQTIMLKKLISEANENINEILEMEDGE